MVMMQKLSLTHYPAGGRREFGWPGAPSGLSSAFDPQAHGGARECHSTVALPFAADEKPGAIHPCVHTLSETSRCFNIFTLVRRCLRCPSDIEPGSSLAHAHKREPFEFMYRFSVACQC